jgi:hypothetical protein
MATRWVYLGAPRRGVPRGGPPASFTWRGSSGPCSKLFDSADAPPLAPDALAGIAPDDWERAVNWTSTRSGESVGSGLRFALNQQERLNLRVDVGVGPRTYGFYLSASEAF